MKCGIYTYDDLSKLTATKYSVASDVTFTGKSGKLKGARTVNTKNYTISASNYSQLPIMLDSGVMIREDNKYTIDIDSTEKAKIIPENIKKDVSILGVTGTAWSEKCLETGLAYRVYPYITFFDVIFSTDKNYLIPSSTDYMFGDNSMLEHVDLSGLDLSQVTSADNMFYYCRKLQSVSGLNFSAKLEVTSDMFNSCSSITSIDLSGFSASNNITNMSGMFKYCSNLASLDLDKLDTSKAANLNLLFASCYELTIDLSKISIASATELYSTFSGVGSFTNITSIKYWDTSKVTTMRSMFSGSGLSGAVTLEWDLSSLTNFSNAFKACKSLTSCSIAADSDISMLDNVNLEYLFYNCTALTFVNLNITATTSDIAYMFSGCTALTTIRIPNLDISSASSSNVSLAFNSVKNCTIYVKNSTIQTLLQNNINSTNTVTVVS